MTLENQSKKMAALALLSVTALASIGDAQRQHQVSRAALEVAGTRLVMGMTKAQVTEKLAGVNIEKLHDDRWMIGSLEKGKEELGPILEFSNGMLSYAEREWSTSANDVPGALFGAMTSLNKEGFSDCHVTADLYTAPDTKAQRVWIHCGEKSVLLITRFIGDHGYTSVLEQLGAMRSIPE